MLGSEFEAFLNALKLLSDAAQNLFTAADRAFKNTDAQEATVIDLGIDRADPSTARNPQKSMRQRSPKKIRVGHADAGHA